MALAGIFFIVAQVAGILYRAYFYMDLGTAQPHVESQSSWLQPLRKDWGLQSPGGSHFVSVTRDHAYLDSDSLRFELRANEFYQDLFGKQSLRSDLKGTQESVICGGRLEGWFRMAYADPTNN